MSIIRGKCRKVCVCKWEEYKLHSLCDEDTDSWEPSQKYIRSSEELSNPMLRFDCLNNSERRSRIICQKRRLIRDVFYTTFHLAEHHHSRKKSNGALTCHAIHHWKAESLLNSNMVEFKCVTRVNFSQYSFKEPFFILIQGGREVLRLGLSHRILGKRSAKMLFVIK